VFICRKVIFSALIISYLKTIITIVREMVSNIVPKEKVLTPEDVIPSKNRSS
jgi:hypothetical protein